MRKYTTIEKIANGFTVEFSGSDDSKPFDSGETFFAADLEGVYGKIREFINPDK